MSETVTVTSLTDKEEFDAYVARPADTPKAAIVVIQEIFGVNAGIRRKCDKLAEDGYLAVAPDLFWRLEPGIELDPDVEPEFQRALYLMGKFDQDQGIRDIEATIKQVREAEKIAKVGCVGYCLGGRLAFLSESAFCLDKLAEVIEPLTDQMPQPYCLPSTRNGLEKEQRFGDSRFSRREMLQTRAAPRVNILDRLVPQGIIVGNFDWCTVIHAKCLALLSLFSLN